MNSGGSQSYTITPAAGYHVTDVLVDGSSVGAVTSYNFANLSNNHTISASFANTPPTANAQSISVVEDGALAITLSGNDPEGSSLSYTIVTVPGFGSLTGTPPNLTYTPAANFNGADSFTFRVNDGLLDSPVATVAITVTPVNDAPLISGAPSTGVIAGTAYSFTPTASDVDGEPLTFSIVNQPAWATFSSSTGALSGTPGSAALGTTTAIVISVSDGTISASLPPFNLTVTDTVPVAAAQTVESLPGAAVVVTLAGAAANGDPLTYTIASQPAYGTLSGKPPSVTYTPNANFIGLDSFTFRAKVGSIDSQPATVSLRVLPDGIIVPAAGKAAPELSDVMKALLFAHNKEVPAPSDLLHGDVAPLVGGIPAPDGQIDIGDALVMLRRFVGLVSW